MNWLFWTLLIAGIVLVIWPFFAALSTGAAIFLWVLGALFIIAAFFVLPTWWARPAVAPAGMGGYSGQEPIEPGAAYPGPSQTMPRGEYRAAETPPDEKPPPPEERRGR